MGPVSFHFTEDTVIVTGSSSGIGRSDRGGVGSGVDEKRAAVEAGDLKIAIPLNRPGYPVPIAPTVLVLASDTADYVTGELVYVDGG
ncbi:SDR family oxidoreductase [Haloarchaeobius sp. HRN-SO-5]|uniref:SDR family oxidoreductase n=1 Tax=Haloarchaeobius sp. HRN-SO-5 TaxID=3446118 RepID=UPI003EBAE55D